jgi:hypothetical protein
VEADLAPGAAPAVTAPPLALAAGMARPASLFASFSIIAPSVGGQAEALEARRHFVPSLPTGPKTEGGKAVAVVLHLFMELLSFRGISTPSLQAQGEQRRPSFFNIGRANAGAITPPTIEVSHDSAGRAPSVAELCAHWLQVPMRLVLDGEPPTQSDLPARDYLGSARSSSQRVPKLNECPLTMRSPAVTSYWPAMHSSFFAADRQRASAATRPRSVLHVPQAVAMLCSGGSSC